MNTDQLQAAQAGVQPPDRRGATPVPDGRRLAWSEWGAPAGQPVLLCTGAALGSSLGFGADHLADLGLRLIALDRPGLGASDPHPAKTLTSWAGDLRAFIAARELHGVTAVGFSQGAPFALALAAHGLVEGVAVVSGQDEFAHPSVLPRAHPDIAGMVGAIRQDPAGFERAFAAMATAEGFWDLIVRLNSEADRVLYESPAFHTAFRRALNEGFSQGAQGYARDLVNAMSPWPFALEEITVPVALWYGAQDASTVHSVDLGATFAFRLPNARRTVDEEVGGSVLWTRAHDILAALRAQVAYTG